MIVNFLFVNFFKVLENRNNKKKKVAILISRGFEEIEMLVPKNFLKENGAKTFIISNQERSVLASSHGKLTKEYKINYLINEVNESSFDAILIPGGIIHIDRLRRDKLAVDFVRDFFLHEKSIAAICHSPILLAETGLMAGRKLTSFFSIKIDLVNAGAYWLDQGIVVEENLITSQGIKQFKEFSKIIVELLTIQKHKVKI